MAANRRVCAPGAAFGPHVLQVVHEGDIWTVSGAGLSWARWSREGNRYAALLKPVIKLGSFILSWVVVVFVLR